MNRNSKSFVSGFILLFALVGFVVAMNSGEYRLALASVTGGLFLWLAFLSMAKMKNSALPLVVTISGLLVGISLFMDSAVEQNMWGGYQVQPDAALFSFVVLLLAMTPGLLLFYLSSPDVVRPPAPAPVAAPAQTASVSSEPEPQAIESNQLNVWNPEDYEIEYDPELIASYYEEGEE